jgi:hypothetical protein
MWQASFIPIISIGCTSIIVFVVFRRCHQPMPSYRSLTTSAYIPPMIRKNWSQWQPSILVSDLSDATPSQDLTIQQLRRLHFLRWLVRHGRLTEWIIIDTSNVA